MSDRSEQRKKDDQETQRNGAPQELVHVDATGSAVGPRTPECRARDGSEGERHRAAHRDGIRDIDRER
jgi:hypothetical protein